MFAKLFLSILAYILQVKIVVYLRMAVVVVEVLLVATIIFYLRLVLVQVLVLFVVIVYLRMVVVQV